MYKISAKLSEDEKKMKDIDFLMLAIGQTPPADWTKHFKIEPETEEQRLQRLSGQRSKRSFKRSTIGAIKANEDGENKDFYYHLQYYYHFQHYFMKVTDLICLVKETEVSFKKIPKFSRARFIFLPYINFF